ncbi:MAG: hypothetical protein MJ113_05890 [Lachnospiraceae bacterium]|nr:hypothetical protein [Lachnospiraceae bacterium]
MEVRSFVRRIKYVVFFVWLGMLLEGFFFMQDGRICAYSLNGSFFSGIEEIINEINLALTITPSVSKAPDNLGEDKIPAAQLTPKPETTQLVTITPALTTTPAFTPAVEVTNTPIPTPTQTLMEKITNNEPIGYQVAPSELTGFVNKYVKAVAKGEIDNLINLVDDKKKLNEEPLKSKLIRNRQSAEAYSDIQYRFMYGDEDVKYIVYLTYNLILNYSDVSIPEHELLVIKRKFDASGKATNELVVDNTESADNIIKSCTETDFGMNFMIEKVVSGYYAGKLLSDKDLLSQMVTDVSALDLNEISRSTEYIENYRNYKCHIFKCNDEIDYVAYLEIDSKIVGITTLAPSLERVLIKLDDSGNPKVYNGAIKKDTASIINKLDNSSDVAWLVLDTNLKLNKALESDNDLRSFYNNLQKAVEK